MLKKLRKLFVKIDSLSVGRFGFEWLFWLATLGFLLITVPAFFVKNHFLYNLEPYPDALLYSLPAQNLAQGRGLALHFADTTLKPWVPPLYSLVLSPVFFLWRSPVAFYLTNLLLGVLSLRALYLLSKDQTKSVFATGLTLLLYLSHSFVLWLPGVAMSENLTLCLMSWLLYLLLKQSFKFRDIPLTLILSLGLVLTRYALFFTAGVASLIAFTRFWSSSSKSQRTSITILGVIGVIIFWITSSLVLQSPWQLFKQMLDQLLQPNSPFFSLSFIPKNLDFYWLALLGDRIKAFLWQFSPLSSWPILTLALASSVSVWLQNKKELRYQMVSLVALFLSQFVLLLHFYAQDSRYIVLSIPILTILIMLSWKWLKQTEWKLIFVGTIILLMPLHLWQQRSLFKQIVGNNLLGRSQAWQYEAIKHFSQQLPADSWLITAIPPYLVDAYAAQQFHVLPLSQHQEFITKNIEAWSLPVTELPSLFTAYDQILQQGQPLYVSNAYLSHEYKVVQDFENLRQHYRLQPLAEGCLQTCTIYQVLGRAEVATPSANPELSKVDRK